MKPETLVSAFPYLYLSAPNIPRSHARYASQVTHDFTSLLNEPCSAEEVRSALSGKVGYHTTDPHNTHPVSYYFWVKPKFDLYWLTTKPTTRPKGAPTERWEAYQTALAWATLHQASHSETTASGSP
jgi:hypothetical protein